MDRSNLDTKLTYLSELRDKRRLLESQKHDIEMDVVIDETGKHQDLSQAALDRHLKVVFHKHPELSDIRQSIMDVSSDIEGVEYDIDFINTSIKIAVSRLNELGGYFQFMAVVKQAALNRKASEAKDDRNPWT